MTNYPNILPTDAVLLIVDKLRGKPSDWNTVLLAAWNILGYALSQISINSPDRILDMQSEIASVKIETEEEAAVFIEQAFLTKGEGDQPVKATGVVLLIIIKLITKFIINVL